MTTPPVSSARRWARRGTFPGFGRAIVRAGALAASALAIPAVTVAQSVDLTGYALGVGITSGSSTLGASGTTLLGRMRLMPRVVDGPVTVDVAYEHLLQRTPVGGGFAITNPGGTPGSSSDLLGLDWSVRSTARTSWRQRFDRLSVSVDAGDFKVTAGRQAISWATTLFLTPADPFSPFDPSDPFREYRGGVDAIRVQTFPGPFSEVEAVVRGSDTPDGRKVTALARAQTSRGGWAVGAWGGVLYGRGAGALFATGAVGATALRAEAEVRRALSGDMTVRSSVGADQRFTVAGRDLYVVVEAQYDGFGATNASELAATAVSLPYARGEMQVLGRWEAASQVSYQLHPLVSVDAMALANLDDGSALVAPGLTWSVTGSVSARFGAFAGVGHRSGSPARLASEYGEVPNLGYLALSWFF